MIMITPEATDREVEELFASVQREIANLRNEVEELTKKLRAGEDTEAKDAKSKVAALSGLLTTCHKVETSLVECRNKRSGSAGGGYALDLDAARAEIGCRLDRLRIRGCQSGVSE